MRYVARKSREESMVSLRTSLVVFSNPVEGREDDYNRWYDDVHLGEVAALPGVASAQRFGLSQVGPQGRFSYLAIYELDGDPAEVLAALSAGMADGSIKMSDAIDLSNVSMTVWEPRTEASAS
jgi:hypothetical protein